MQYSGSRFPSSVQRMSPMTAALSTCVDKGSIVKRTALRTLIQSIQQRCKGSLRHYISRVLQSPLPRDSPLHDGECGSRKHSAISPSRHLCHLHRSCGYPFPHTHPQRLQRMSSISDSGHHIPIPVTAVWPFASTLGIHQVYDRDQMLVHLMGNWFIYSPSHDQWLRDTV